MVAMVVTGSPEDDGCNMRNDVGDRGNGEDNDNVGNYTMTSNTFITKTTTNTTPTTTTTATTTLTNTPIAVVAA